MGSHVSIFRRLAGPGVLVGLILIILAPSLFSGGRLVPTAAGSDVQLQFLGWRSFAFSQWMQGHFPLWDPHVFSGLPFFAQMQSNLLYPICWIYFLLKTGVAANVEIALHLCIAGVGTYLWARQRSISRPGATLAGAAYTFSGQVYLRVMAGHLDPLATISWIPLGFLCIDRLLERRFLSGILLGAFAICMQMLGGYPQCSYYAAIVGGIYLLLESIGRPRPVRIYAAFFAMYALGGMLAAVQLIPAVRASGLSIRAGGTTYSFASTFALSPENLLFLFFPYPYGDLKHIDYVGRWFLWEMSIYAGLLTLTLACIAITYRSKSARWKTLLLLLTVVILMLGPATPVHKLLYRFLPGFRMFRGASKFGTVWTLLIAMLAGEGFDQIRRFIPDRRIIRAAIVAAIGFLLVGACLGVDTSARFLNAVLHRVADHGQFVILTRLLARPDLVLTLNRWECTQASVAGGLLLALAMLLYWQRFSAKAAYVLMVLAIAEVYIAAAVSTMHTPAQSPAVPQWNQQIAEANAAHQRVLFTDSEDYGNAGNSYGYDSIWGYDPGQPKRYTRLLATSQGEQDVPEDQYFSFVFHQMSPIFSLLRCRYILQSLPSERVVPIPDPYPRLLLVGAYQKMTDSDAIAARLADANFDARHTVILESDPVPAPTASGAVGTVALLRESVNDMDITADLPAPAVLLITDGYDPGWRVRGLTSPDIMQADDVLRAIPLPAGHHHFDLYYTVPGIRAGIGISALGWGLWLVGIAGICRAPRSRRIHV